MNHMHIFGQGIAFAMLAAAPSIAQEGKAAEMANPQKSATANQVFVTLDTVTGRDLVRSDSADSIGEVVGRIEDLVFDSRGSLVEFVVSPATPKTGATTVMPGKVVVMGSQVTFDPAGHRFMTKLGQPEVAASPKFTAPARKNTAGKASPTKDKDDKGKGNVEDAGHHKTADLAPAGVGVAPDRVLALEIANMPVYVQGVAAGQAKRAWLHPDSRQLAFLEITGDAGPRLLPWSLAKPQETERGLQIDATTTIDKLKSAPSGNEDPSDQIARGRVYAHFGVTAPAWDTTAKGGPGKDKDGK